MINENKSCATGDRTSWVERLSDFNPFDLLDDEAAIIAFFLLMGTIIVILVLNVAFDYWSGSPNRVLGS